MEKHIFRNNKDKHYLFIPISSDFTNIELVEQYPLHRNNYAIQYTKSIKSNNDFLDKLNAVACRFIHINVKSDKPIKLKYIGDFNSIKKKKATKIIDSKLVDTDGIYYTDYLTNEPITDGDWKYSLKTAIKSILDEFDNVAIIKIKK